MRATRDGLTHEDVTHNVTDDTAYRHSVTSERKLSVKKARGRKAGLDRYTCTSKKKHTHTFCLLLHELSPKTHDAGNSLLQGGGGVGWGGEGGLGTQPEVAVVV